LLVSEGHLYDKTQVESKNQKTYRLLLDHLNQIDDIIQIDQGGIEATIILMTPLLLLHI
jgi:hypothetical protein